MLGDGLPQLDRNDGRPGRLVGGDGARWRRRLASARAWSFLTASSERPIAAAVSATDMPSMKRSSIAWRCSGVRRAMAGSSDWRSSTCRYAAVAATSGTSATSSSECAVVPGQAAEVVHQVVVGDAVQPGGEGQAALDVPIQLLVDLDEDVLGQILDDLVRAVESAAEEAVHQWRVLLVQRRERRLIALLRLAHQLCHCLHRSVPLPFPVSVSCLAACAALLDTVSHGLHQATVRRTGFGVRYASGFWTKRVQILTPWCGCGLTPSSASTIGGPGNASARGRRLQQPRQQQVHGRALARDASRLDPGGPAVRLDHAPHQVEAEAVATDAPTIRIAGRAGRTARRRARAPRAARPGHGHER